MPRKQLPQPPGAGPVGVGGKAKGRDLPPEPVYDERQNSAPPPQVTKRPTRPLPPQPTISVESTGEQYEVVDIPQPKIPDQTYDDFDTQTEISHPSPAPFEQTTYDDFEVQQPKIPQLPSRGAADNSSRPLPTPKKQDWPDPPAPDEFYDDMDELKDPVPSPAAVKPPGKRDPLPPPPQISEETYDDWADVAPPTKGLSPKPPGKQAPLPAPPEETYDEVEEGVSNRRTFPVPISKPAPSLRDEYEEEIYEECDEQDSPDESRMPESRPIAGRQMAPAPYSEEIYDDPEGEEYEDPGDVRKTDSYGDEGNVYDQEDDQWEESAPPLPSRPQAPKMPPQEPPIPSLPQRPTGGTKKQIVKPPQAAAGLDLSQILNVKLKKVDTPTISKAKTCKASRNADSHIVNWSAGLKKRSDSQDEEVQKEIKPLQPPNFKLKKTGGINIPQVEISQPVVKPDPPKKMERPVKTPRNTTSPPMSPAEPAPISVQVSPPPVNKGSPPPRKNSVPELDLPKVDVPSFPRKQPLPNPPTAIVRPERHVDNNSNEVKPAPTRSLPSIPPESQDKEQDSLLPYDWYHGNITRQETEQRLRSVDGDGVFLVRKSKQGSESQPYTMTILYKDNIFTLKIRCRETDRKIALGEEKNGEMTFSSVPSLVSYHKDHDVILIGNPGGETKLLNHPKRV